MYECGVRLNRMEADGTVRKVAELYLVDAMTFAEAEGRMVKELHNEVDDGFDVAAIRRTSYAEALRSGKDDADAWFKAKVNFITVNEKSGKEKRHACHYIIEAADFDDARKTIGEHLRGSVVDYEIATVDKTKIVDIFAPHWQSEANRTLEQTETTEKEEQR